jgi:hypothetical protein
MNIERSIITDCIFINPEHQGEAARLLATVAAELRMTSAPLPPSLASWEAHMQRIAEWQARRDAERVRRVKAERALRWVATVNATDYEYQRVAREALGMAQEATPKQAAPNGWRARLQAWRERTGFLMDGRDGGM